MSSIGRRLASLERRGAQASASTRCPECGDDPSDAMGTVQMRMTFEGDENAGPDHCGTCGRVVVMRLTFDDAVADLIDRDDSKDLQDTG
jgi:hypothetical protein